MRDQLFDLALFFGLDRVFNPSTNLVYRICKPFFDQSYYLASNRDVAGAAVDPLKHYLEFGWREGRNPRRDFLTAYYVDKHSRSISSWNPLYHYARIGACRNFATYPDNDEMIAFQADTIADYFDEEYFRSRNPDLIGSKSELIRLYLTRGRKQDRKPRRDFDPIDYASVHPEIANSPLDPFYHYIVFDPSARKPAREDTRHAAISTEVKAIVSGSFDASYYLKANIDVRSAQHDPLDHFLEYGWRERRNPTKWFWTDFYLKNNPDVAADGNNPFYHYLKYGAEEGRKPNPIGRETWPRPKAPAAEEWAALTKRKEAALVSVIVPVYVANDEAREDTLACLHAVLSSRNKTPFELIAINDCSPNSAFNEELRSIAKHGYFTYLENDTNLGFVGTINRGLAACSRRDAILLNSDAIVSGDWIDRMVAHAAADPNVATITPLSNNATVCSYPDFNHDNVIALERSPAELDELAKRCNAGLRTEVPSGVGFCFFMRRAVIDAVGDLDFETFGRGYGEENDFCMRALKAGYKNVMAHDIFVFHTGEVSFAEVAGSRRDNAQKLLEIKHPDYGSRVWRYLSADLGKIGRMRLDAERLVQTIGPKSYVFFTHDWGGGIRRHIDDMKRQLVREGKKVIIISSIRDKEDGLCIAEVDGLYLPNLLTLNVFRDEALLRSLFTRLKPALVHVHTFAGLRHPARHKMMDIIQNSGTPYAYTWHDFAPLCHRNQFVRDDGQYCGEPSLPDCEICVASDFRAFDYETMSERHKSYLGFLKGARHVFAPSEAAARRAEVMSPVTLRQHPEQYAASSWIESAPKDDRPLVIAVVGAVGVHKGSDLLYAMAIDAEARKLPMRFCIIGTCDRTDIGRFSCVEVRGAYEGDTQAIKALKELSPHLTFFPSIWPETFCYALSLAIETGIPPVAFGLGAQGDRVKKLGWGVTLPAGDIADPKKVNDALLSIPVGALWSARTRVKAKAYEDLAADYYGWTQH